MEVRPKIRPQTWAQHNPQQAAVSPHTPNREVRRSTDTHHTDIVLQVDRRNAWHLLFEGCGEVAVAQEILQGDNLHKPLFTHAVRWSKYTNVRNGA